MQRQALMLQCLFCAGVVFCSLYGFASAACLQLAIKKHIRMIKNKTKQQNCLFQLAKNCVRMSVECTTQILVCLLLKLSLLDLRCSSGVEQLFPCISYSRASREAQSPWLLSPVLLILGPEVSSSVSSEPRLKFAALLTSHKATEKVCITAVVSRKLLLEVPDSFLVESQQFKSLAQAILWYLPNFTLT